MKHENIRRILSEKGISIRKCATEIGISQPDLCNAINGVKPMYPKYRRLLSEYLDIDEELLFPDENGGERND